MAEQARILERGYRSYEGERGGVAAAVRTTAKHSIQRSLGMKRTIWQKVLPGLSIALAYIPAIVFVGFVAMSERFRLEADVGPGYADYYGFVSAAILVFTAFVAPEILCTDRRSGMLGLYLASPLNRNTYLIAKAIGVMTVLTIVTTGPVLLMLIGKTILGRGPDGFGGWLATLGRVVLAGLAVSGLHGSFSLAVSSLTSRRAVASAAFVAVLLTSLTTTVSLVDGGASPNLVALNLFSLPFNTVYRIYGEASPADDYRGVSTALIVGANIGWTLLFSVVVWWRYRKLAVTK